ncbi:MAG: hypothetical protein AAFY29_22830 [Pseudomonadota bacterium]
MNLSYQDIKMAADIHGYAFFDRGDYNLNIVGIRNSNPEPENFDDTIAVAFRQNGKPQIWTFAATTDPSTYFLEHPMHVRGTAIVVPGQYRSVWKWGKHKGEYPALVQAGLIRIWRDNNRDAVINSLCPRNGANVGINLHRAGRHTISNDPVDKWSAGCQVIAEHDEFNLLMCLIARARLRWGNFFTYTLYDEYDDQGVHFTMTDTRVSA